MYGTFHGPGILNVHLDEQDHFGNYFASSPGKAVSWVARMGRNFDDYLPGFPAHEPTLMHKTYPVAIHYFFSRNYSKWRVLNRKNCFLILSTFVSVLRMLELSLCLCQTSAGNFYSCIICSISFFQWENLHWKLCVTSDE